MKQNLGKLDSLIGLALLGASITGAVSFVAALFPFAVGDYAAVGTRQMSDPL